MRQLLFSFLVLVLWVPGLFGFRPVHMRDAADVVVGSLDRPGKGVVIHYTLVGSSDEGGLLNVDFVVMSKAIGENDRAFLIRILDTDQAGSGLLFRIRKGKSVVHRYDSTMGVVEVVRGRGLGDYFFGSAWQLADIVDEEGPENFIYADLVPSELGGQTCYRIEAVARSRRPDLARVYGKRIFWINQGDGLLQRIECYRPGGGLAKVITVDKHCMLEGHRGCYAERMTVSDLRTGRLDSIVLTRLFSSPDLPDAYFTPENFANWDSSTRETFLNLAQK